ncbi:MAG: transporter substrate-binding domain-containing protein, partial [Oscillospiraceae bacterium]
MFKKLRKTLTAAAACLVFFALSFVVYADNGSLKKTVRVGYTDYYGFIEQNPNGEFSGYGVDYLDELAHYTDWRYEYVYCNWDTAIEKLQNDEIDLLCNATPNAENRKTLAFSQYSIGVEQFVLYCLPTTDLCFDDFENFDGKNMGVL